MPSDLVIVHALQQVEAAEAESADLDSHRKEVARFAHRLAQALPDRQQVPRSVVEHLLAAVAAFAAPEVASHE